MGEKKKRNRREFASCLTCHSASCSAIFDPELPDASKKLASKQSEMPIAVVIVELCTEEVLEPRNLSSLPRPDEE